MRTTKLTQRRRNAKTLWSWANDPGVEASNRGLRPISAERETIFMSKLMSLRSLLPEHAERAAGLSSVVLPTPKTQTFRKDRQARKDEETTTPVLLCALCAFAFLHSVFCLSHHRALPLVGQGPPYGSAC